MNTERTAKTPLLVQSRRIPLSIPEANCYAELLHAAQHPDNRGFICEMADTGLANNVGRGCGGGWRLTGNIREPHQTTRTHTHFGVISKTTCEAGG